MARPKRTYVNEQIRIPQVRLIDDAGKDQGVMDTAKALNFARSKGLDLVEVVPIARPPVCKIMDYGQYQYQRDKKARKQKGRSKRIETKGIRLGFSTGENDIKIKVKRAEKFMKEGHRVKIELILRGRENTRRAVAFEKLDQFIALIGVKNKVETKDRQGNRLFAIIAPR